MLVLVLFCDLQRKPTVLSSNEGNNGTTGFLLRWSVLMSSLIYCILSGFMLNVL